MAFTYAPLILPNRVALLRSSAFTGEPYINFGKAGSIIPVITGSTVGGGLLTASEPTGKKKPFTWQWRRNGTNISGATSQTYTTVGADEGATIDVVATNVDGSYTSDPIGPITVGFSWPYGTDALWSNVALMHDFSAGSYWYPDGTYQVSDQKAGIVSPSNLPITSGALYQTTDTTRSLSAGTPLIRAGQSTPFCCEWWYACASGTPPQYQPLVYHGGASPGLVFVMDKNTTAGTPSAGLRGYFDDAGISPAGTEIMTSAVVAAAYATTYQHYAMIYDGNSNVLRMYLNGVQLANKFSTNGVYVGAAASILAFASRGYLRSIRYTIGSIRYTGADTGVSFTPDTNFGKG